MSFQTYSGPASNFPAKSTWKDFDTLFNINKPTMLQTGDSGQDVGRIYNAIVDAAKIGVEERVILCIIMQESRGNVGVNGPTNQDGKVTGGLMQAVESPGFPGQYNLSQVCLDLSPFILPLVFSPPLPSLRPSPFLYSPQKTPSEYFTCKHSTVRLPVIIRIQAQISSMVQAGTNHYKGDLKQLDDADTASTIYRALRLYNSGSINESNLSDGKGATPSYVSDIANRLQGRTNG
ncbi:MAG: hypothetical protein L6R37_007127 [Teloschistes peruensis]|nr:MAG: hypothetical protein L6R37_007127 [Teloschistes peruensis]